MCEPDRSATGPVLLLQYQWVHILTTVSVIVTDTVVNLIQLMPDMLYSRVYYRHPMNTFVLCKSLCTSG